MCYVSNRILLAIITFVLQLNEQIILIQVTFKSFNQAIGFPRNIHFSNVKKNISGGSYNTSGYSQKKLYKQIEYRVYLLIRICRDYFNFMYISIVHRCGANGSMPACHAAGSGLFPGRDRFPG